MIFLDIMFVTILIFIAGIGGRCAGNVEMCQNICDPAKAIVNFNDGTCECILRETEVPITKIVAPSQDSTTQLICEE